MEDVIINPYTKQPYTSRSGRRYTYRDVPEKYHGKIESPAEATFIRAIARDRSSWIEQLESQYQISVDDRAFRLDFAFVDLQFAIEIDGYHHRTDEFKKKDKERDEILASVGWIVTRVSAHHVKSKSKRNKVLDLLDLALGQVQRGETVSRHLMQSESNMIVREVRSKRKARKQVKVVSSELTKTADQFAYLSELFSGIEILKICKSEEAVKNGTFAIYILNFDKKVQAWVNFSLRGTKCLLHVGSKRVWESLDSSSHSFADAVSALDTFLSSRKGRSLTHLEMDTKRKMQETQLK